MPKQFRDYLWDVQNLISVMSITKIREYTLNCITKGEKKTKLNRNISFSHIAVANRVRHFHERYINRRNKR